MHFLTKKDKVFTAFKEFKAQLENKLEHKIKVLHTDRGGEYMSRKMETFLKEEGIIYKKTAPYSPQSNDIAERFNRTLLEEE